jgi:predicted kinase
MKIGVVVTGIPASGKTTIARSIARSLSFDLIDKDDFLEDLYALNDVKTWDDRKALSRQSDILFQDAAEKSGSAVLVSHWKPLAESGESGTPSDWLKAVFTSLIEVHCSCPPDIALDRFLARQRHPGHFDKQRDPVELARRLKGFECGYPLGIGPVLEIRTDIEVDQQAVVDQLRRLLNDMS